MNRIILYLGLVFAFATLNSAASPAITPATKLPLTDSKFSYSPPNGCVPDAKTAFKIAFAVLGPIYGEKEIEFNRPFVAILRHGVWTVAGTGFHPDIEGGGMEIDISKKDGKILRIYAGM